MTALIKKLSGYSLTWKLLLVTALCFTCSYEVLIPHHSKDSPEFIGACQVNNKEVPNMIVAILENEIGMKTLSAKAAWKIDKKRQGLSNCIRKDFVVHDVELSLMMWGCYLIKPMGIRNCPKICF